MAIELSFADIPFRLPTADIIAFVERFGLLDMPDVDQITDAGRLTSLAVPRIQPYCPRLGEFWFPSGMSRCAIFHGIATGEDCDSMIEAVNDNNGYGTFVMQNDGLGGTQKLSYSMYLLPPRPLAYVDNDAAGGLSLVTLVDFRFQLRLMARPYATSLRTCDPTIINAWSAGPPSYGFSMLDWFVDGTIDPGGGSNPLITQANLPNPSSVYGQPEPDSQLLGVGDRLGVMLDAICANIGGFISPNLNNGGSNTDPCIFTTWNQAAANTLAARLASSKRVAGYAVFDPDQSKADPARQLVLPSQFWVAFPWYLTQQVANAGPPPYLPAGYVDLNLNRDHYRKGWNYGLSYGVNIDTASLGAPYADNCFTSSAQAYVYISTTAKALADGISGSSLTTPTNDSYLTALATQLAKDYCDHELACLDEVYQGIQPWPSNTGHDLLYRWDADTCFTRVRRRPYNSAPREFQHSFGPQQLLVQGSATSINNGTNISGNGAWQYFGPLVINAQGYWRILWRFNLEMTAGNVPLQFLFRLLDQTAPAQVDPRSPAVNYTDQFESNAPWKFWTLGNLYYQPTTLPASIYLGLHIPTGTPTPTLILSWSAEAVQETRQFVDA